MTIKNKIENQVLEAVEKVFGLKLTAKDINIDAPANPDFGDYSTGVSFILAKQLKKAPFAISSELQKALNLTAAEEGIVEAVEVANGGFVNFRLSEACLLKELKEALGKGEGYGDSLYGEGKKVIVEFVSANPTGPLHIGHGRGAAFGDSLSRLLKKAGFSVHREYYINDRGIQMQLLGRSLKTRVRQLLGENIDIGEGYTGDYLLETARKMLSEKNIKTAAGLPPDEAFTEYARTEILGGIKEDLDRFNVTFDEWFSEMSLFKSGAVDRTLKKLEEKNFLYEKDNALWVKSSEINDEKDRVVRKENGEYTYLAPDIAYHAGKFDRGFDKLIDIWGADHHGYVDRLKSSIKVLGYDEDRFDVILIQFVNLIRGGEKMSMSTRGGKFVTLREVLDWAGPDAARFYLLTRHQGSHLDFDLDLVKKQTDENIVYYIQYAHARICSVFREAAKRGIAAGDPASADLSLLNTEEEVLLLKKIASYPDEILRAAALYEPHKLTFFIFSLASLFHRYYNVARIIDEQNIAHTKSRLFLAGAVKTVISGCLGILGVSSPDKM